MVANYMRYRNILGKGKRVSRNTCLSNDFELKVTNLLVPQRRTGNYPYENTMYLFLTIHRNNPTIINIQNKCLCDVLCISIMFQIMTN